MAQITNVAHLAVQMALEIEGLPVFYKQVGSCTVIMAAIRPAHGSAFHDSSRTTKIIGGQPECPPCLADTAPKGLDNFAQDMQASGCIMPANLSTSCKSDEASICCCSNVPA